MMQQMIFICLTLLLLALSCGCGQSDIKVYRVAKAEAAAPPQSAQSLPSGHPGVAESASPTLKWTLPAGWEEVAPAEMRVASFRVKGAEGKQADVSIVPLSGMAGGALANVNRWRDQLGLAAITEGALSKIAEPVEIGGRPAKLFEQAGKLPASSEPARILGAIQDRDGTTWFFKMTGDDQLVAGQKPAFIGFLKSLSFAVTPSTSELPPSHPPLDSTAVTATQLPGASGSGEAKPKWQVPAGWKETSGQFLVAKFLLSGPDDTRAAVNVSVTGGGLVANVNRWRRHHRSNGADIPPYALHAGGLRRGLGEEALE